jgi:hypothetical protein
VSTAILVAKSLLVAGPLYRLVQSEKPPWAEARGVSAVSTPNSSAVKKRMFWETDFIPRTHDPFRRDFPFDLVFMLQTRFAQRFRDFSFHRLALQADSQL